MQRVLVIVGALIVPTAIFFGCSDGTTTGAGSSSSSSGTGGSSSSSGEGGNGGTGGGASSSSASSSSGTSSSSSTSGSSGSSSGAGGAGAFAACTDTVANVKDCKNCCECAANLSCMEQRACRDTCNALGDAYFMMNPNPMPVMAPSMLGSGGDYSACTATSADEKACKECCDCTTNFLCGDHQFCRNACTAAFGDGGAPPPVDAGGDGG